MRLVIALAVLLVPAAAPAGQDDAKPRIREKLICKKWADTGSLVVRKRECHTREDWNRIADSQQRGARLLADGLTGRPCGGDSCAPPPGAISSGIQRGY